MVDSFRFAGEGLIWSFRNHRNVRIFVLIGCAVIIASLYFGVTREEFFILFFTVILAFMAELMNTALESVTDLITVKWSHQAKIAKDIGAAMSLIAAVASVIVGILIFAPYLVANR